MKIAIVGANGQLGRDLVRVLAGRDVVALDHQDIDICDALAVNRVIAEIHPGILINCAAYNRVDDAEDHPKEAFAVNAEGVLHLARAAERCGALLIHVSTDFVFGGEKREPYRVDDAPEPLGVYGLSKLAGEWMARRYASKHLVVRTCGLYGLGASRSKGTNFVESMIRLAENGRPARVVNDQIVCPTSTRDLAAGLAQLMEANRYGVYHMTNQGQCSWFEFAQQVFARLGKEELITPIASSGYPLKAARPRYSVLDNSRLRDVGVAALQPWQSALSAYLEERLGTSRLSTSAT